MALPTLTINLGEDYPSVEAQLAARRQDGNRSPVSTPLAPAPPVKPTPGKRRLPGSASMILSNALAHAMADNDAKIKTQAELEEAKSGPQDSPQPTLAEQRRVFEREQIGPSIVAFPCGDLTLYARRFSFGAALYLTLLFPLDAEGYLDAGQPEKLAYACAEALRLGLCRDAQGTPYFDNKGDAVAYIDDDATSGFAGAAIMRIDTLNRLFPKRPTQDATPPKTRAQQRLERLKAKETQGAETAPDSPQTATSKEQTQ